MVWACEKEGKYLDWQEGKKDVGGGKSGKRQAKEKVGKRY